MKARLASLSLVPAVLLLPFVLNSCEDLGDVGAVVGAVAAGAADGLSGNTNASTAYLAAMSANDSGGGDDGTVESAAAELSAAIPSYVPARTPGVVRTPAPAPTPAANYTSSAIGNLPTMRSTYEAAARLARQAAAQYPAGSAQRQQMEQTAAQNESMAQSFSSNAPVVR